MGKTKRRLSFDSLLYALFYNLKPFRFSGSGSVDFSSRNLTPGAKRFAHFYASSLRDSYKSGSLLYASIAVTTPAPTVWPPSRIAKRKPSSIAIGVINSMSISMLSPGITISVPSGKLQTPVTSVVRK